MLFFHTDNLPHHGLERIFELAKRGGFDGIEVGINSNLDTQNPEYLKTLETRYKIPIRAFSMAVKSEEKLTEAFQTTVREFNEVILNLHAPLNLSFKYQKWLEEVAPRLAKKYNLTLCYRNVPFESLLGIFPARKNNTLNALKSLGLVCADLTALALSNEDIMRSIETLGSHLRHIYLSNVSHHIPYSLPSKGVLPIESFLTKLAKSDWRGNFTVYVSGHELDETNDPMIVQRMEETRQFFEKYFVNEQKRGRE